MQESRLFRIIYYLIEKGKSTAPELAKKFEVSVRTIYRDIDVISSVGILFTLHKEKTVEL
ncbi:HTH domain-containing protein (plasmid) [Clostridium perfringens]|uniref:HTH domain-containing protein n=1 Tax=Clostridium perfringens TaxID=1502 RepID=UPI0024BD3D38|nr:HTH domain-containing protein [Clostridium perfringens]